MAILQCVRHHNGHGSMEVPMAGAKRNSLAIHCSTKHICDEKCAKENMTIKYKTRLPISLSIKISSAMYSRLPTHDGTNSSGTFVPDTVQDKPSP